MWFNNVSEKQKYSRAQLFSLFCKEKEKPLKSSFDWEMYNLQKNGKLFKVGRNCYSSKKPIELPSYVPAYSDKAIQLQKYVKRKFPNLEFVIFETVLLNEFLNHLIAQNTIFIQIPKEVNSFVFDVLRQDSEDKILYKPSKKDFLRYQFKDCIVISDLLSQSPISSTSPNTILLEKMMVDIIADKNIASVYSPAELPEIYEYILNHYNLNIAAMIRYAGRRNKIEKIKELIGK